MAVRAYEMLPVSLANFIGIVLPFAEIGMGLLLILGAVTRITAGLSALLMVVFVIGISQAWARGLSIDCGCFGGGGTVDPGETKYLSEILRDIGLVLVALGQFSFVASITTLSVLARLKRFDISLEEAAYNLGASGFTVFRTITLPYLRPALIGSAAIAFLMSFENFNTTLMLVGSDAPLTIMMYGRMREGASPVLNAVSLVLMLLTAAMAIAMP